MLLGWGNIQGWPRHLIVPGSEKVLKHRKTTKNHHNSYTMSKGYRKPTGRGLSIGKN